MAVDQRPGGHRPAAPRRGDPGHLAVLHLGQDEQGRKAQVGVDLRGQGVGEVEAQPPGQGQPPADAQVGDVVGLEPGKALPGGRGYPAYGVGLYRAEHGPGQLEDGAGAVCLRHPRRLGQGQDQLFRGGGTGQGVFGQLRPALEPGPEGGPGGGGAAGQRRQNGRLHRPGAGRLPLVQQAVEGGAAQLARGAARQVPGPALHLHLDALGGERGAAGLGQAAAEGLRRVGAGGLHRGVAVGEGPVAVPVGGGQLLAVGADLQPEADRHPGPLTPVELPQRGQGPPGLGGVGLAAGAEHRAVDPAVQVPRGKA